MANNITQKPRITSGMSKNYKLKVPQSARPLTDRIKLSIFDTIHAYLDNAQVLDLYAGAGSFGLEALSRGAATAVFVENDGVAVNMLDANVSGAGFLDRAVVLRKSVADFIQNNREKFDIIFIDPPFAHAHRFEIRQLKKLMHEDSIAIFRTPVQTEVPEYKTLPITYTEKLGDSKIHYIRYQTPTS